MLLLQNFLKNLIFQNNRNSYKKRKQITRAEDWDRIWVRSRSGGIISAAFTKSRNYTPNNLVVLVPPLSIATKEIFYNSKIVSSLKKTGSAIITFDFNGIGESKTGNFNYIYDLVAVLKKSQEILPKQPIVLISITTKELISIVKFEKLNEHNLEFIETLSLSDNILLKNLKVNKPLFLFLQNINLVRKIKVSDTIHLMKPEDVTSSHLFKSQITDLKTVIDELKSNYKPDIINDNSQVSQILTENSHTIIDAVNKLLNPSDDCQN